MKLTSARLYFRPLSALDATEAYAAWLNDPEVNQYLETRYAVQTVASCKAFIEDMNQSETDHLFGIFLRENNLHIGNIKLGFINTRYQSAQISLLIGEKSSWGSGFATEAIRSISQFGFRDLALVRLEAGCYEDNLGSLRAFLKAGYAVEGFCRQQVVANGRRQGCFYLGMLKSEWQDE